MSKETFIPVKCAMIFGLILAVCQDLKGQQSLSQPDGVQMKYLSFVGIEPPELPRSDNSAGQ